MSSLSSAAEQRRFAMSFRVEELREQLEVEEEDGDRQEEEEEVESGEGRIKEKQPRGWPCRWNVKCA